MSSSPDLNRLWSRVIGETLTRLGLKQGVICPGSRSTPLTLAFTALPGVELIPILDERSAAFFALGMAKRSQIPVILICTSGSAAANFYPAIIEAKYSKVPLLVLTADRPQELRECHSGQTINQVNLYGSYPQLQRELPTPELSLLSYVRQTLVHAWQSCLTPQPGVVHLNCPFREPLTPQGPIPSLPEDFFDHLEQGRQEGKRMRDSLPIPPEWHQCSEGVIIAGLASPQDPYAYAQGVADLAKDLGWPVLAEALSPLRNYQQLNPYLISTYDLILRQSEVAQSLVPQEVVQLGELPISKELRQWLEKYPCRRWVIASDGDNYDPLHGKTRYLRGRVEDLVVGDKKAKVTSYLRQWLAQEESFRAIIDQKLDSLDQLVEAKVAWLVARTLAHGTAVFLANSMTVRYCEFFWGKSDRALVPYFNRGTNGIDGTLATALGIAHQGNPTVMLTGDLALLHDTNALLTRRHFQGHLTIILINNNGGGIFEFLPIAEFDPPFEEFFATPQHIDFSQLAQVYGLGYHLIKDWQQLELLLNPLPDQGIRLLEIQTDRSHDAQWLKRWWQSLVTMEG